MGALKALVVVMGVLLVGGTAALIVAIVDRASHRTPASPAGRGFDPVAVDLPVGARVLSAEVGGDRILVRVGLADGGEQLILIDARNGALLGTVDLRTGGTRP